MENANDNLPQYQSPISMYGSAITTLTNPDDQLYKLELSLKGYREVDGKLISTGKPLLNDVGVQSVISQVQSLVSQIGIMSNLDRNEVSNLCVNAADILIKDLIINGFKYDIKNSADKDIIWGLVVNNIFLALKRAFQEGDRRFWKGSQQDVNIKNTSQAAGQGSIFSKVLGWGNKNG